jgi:hypothetical protein
MFPLDKGEEFRFEFKMMRHRLYSLDSEEGKDGKSSRESNSSRPLYAEKR